MVGLGSFEDDSTIMQEIVLRFCFRNGPKICAVLSLRDFEQCRAGATYATGRQYWPASWTGLQQVHNLTASAVMQRRFGDKRAEIRRRSGFVPGDDISDFDPLVAAAPPRHFEISTFTFQQDSLKALIYRN